MTRSERVRLIKTLIVGLARLPEFEIRLIFREFAGVQFSVWNESFEDAIQGYLSDCVDDTLLELNEHLAGTGPLPGVTQDAQDRIWTSGGFRLFMSHIEAHTEDVVELRKWLGTQGVDGFVAHSVIEPSRDWEDEIIAALRSCHAVAAFLHPGFKESEWADQEVGYGLGRGVALVPVCYDDDPHGLLTRTQGIKAAAKNPYDVSVEIVNALIGNESTQDEMAPVIVNRLAGATTPTKATNWLGRLDRVRHLSEELLRDLHAASTANKVLTEPPHQQRIQAVLDRHGYTAAVTGYDPNEEPF